MYAAALLVAAIAIEVVSTALLPRADGFRNLTWSAIVLLGYGTSIWLLSVVVQRMPVSVAYAIWSGLGTALVAAIGVMFLGEHLSAAKAAFLAMIVVGVVGLNLSGAH
ncbi:small multidrug resistance pump [Nocardioides luteus]|uniref:QacE family quaternary ammonium compound efflux SMR transporter n=1 Tax=Nocardioides luteus TaxID=1844 RepID=A0ABQ5SUL7_9ACTN|nr:multidrug efflux SMR transporter [Nocardioides luteus]MDR7309482.1 small multidrug resistance pump [Nocardioides luteus]GGR51524.1 QacE family quaternary ammonium compound efflux SMR transporter [Nocardioides luteus]GLJ67887.1 QacE family quaternary ammonium compound efflux SMR transporter [Nocardioides luteus]